MGDPWLVQCRSALNDFLTVADHVLGSEPNPNEEGVEAFTIAERALVDALRDPAWPGQPTQDRGPFLAVDGADPQHESRAKR